MAWQIRYKDRALDELLEIQEPQRRRIVERVSFLKDDPFPPGSKKLRGSDEFYRIRIGDYRVVYNPDRVSAVIRILRVRHRRDAYRGL